MEKTYKEDIFSQPESLKRCVEGLAGREKDLKELREKGYRKVIFTGMGSSNYCSLAADRYLVQHGWTSFRYSAAELLYGYLDMIKEDTLLVMISQSGESVEILKLLDKIPDGVCIVAITNDPESTLARKSDHAFFMNVEQEKAVTTRTYMAGIAISLFLAAGLCALSFQDFLNGLLKVTEKMQELLGQISEKTEELRKFAEKDSAVWVLGRGIDHGTALAGALFFREVSRMTAVPESCGEFRHGPFEVVDKDFLGILISTDKEIHEANKNLIRDIREKGGKLLVISDQPEEEPAVRLPDCGKWYGQFLGIIPLQIIADLLAAEKGITAGEFRWGSKVTKVE